MNDVLNRIRGGLVVSCQAYPGEPMLDPRTMAQVAQAAVAGGAVAIRAKGLDDLRAMRPVLDVPLIGLVKVGAEGVYITPTLADARAVADTGCEIVALDGTRRPRPDGLSLAETVAGLKQSHPGVLVMADEIHCDFVMKGQKYIPFASLPDKKIVNNSITYKAASKSFGLAAHKTASFFPEVPVIFAVDGTVPHYHIPLLLSPYGFSTYRGN